MPAKDAVAQTTPGFVALYRRVLGLLRPERGVVAMLLVANLFAAALGYVEPILFGRVVDLLTGSGRAEPFDTTGSLLASWAVAGLGGIGLSIAVAWQADRLAHRRRLAALSAFFEHVLQLPPAFHDATHSARLLKIMLTGTDHLFAVWLGFFREHFANLIALFVLLPLTLLLNWRLGLLLIGLVAVFAIVTGAVIHRTHTLQWEVERHHSDLAQRAGDALGNVVLIQSFVRLGAEVRALREVADRLLAAQFPVLGWWALLSVLTRAASTVATLAIFALGAFLVRNGAASVGEIVTFMGFATLLIGRLESVLGFFRALFFQRPALAEFFSVLDTASTVVERPDAIELPRLRGEIVFDRVCFAYRPGKPALFDLSVRIPAGTRVAIVGSSGAGKSTMLALLLRLYDPDSGRITIDGYDIRDATLASLRRNIGVVFQHSTLFQRSIAENLRIGKPDASAAELEAAARLAQAHEFVRALPEGFETVLGEGGARLSGGERQRLAIARALLKDPPILLMDEATSALDARTEERLRAALAAVMRNRTVLIIAHRLSTIRDVDLVLVLDRGRLVEQGTYEELVRKGGVFADLVRAQHFSEAETQALLPLGSA
ncbi:MAG: glucan ABC transporter ATP-binding protein/ permease [Geminicoccaceae bacterium]|nr:glucan ABC transporter ATP-binding protein/ permease [Geminicoccaceae bacterium]